MPKKPMRPQLKRALICMLVLLKKNTRLLAAALLILLAAASPLPGGALAARAADSNDASPGQHLLLAENKFSVDDIKTLIGRWRRPDGGYVLEIREITPDGKMDAYYFNPNSINVHRAEAARVAGEIKLVVELRDAGYPGSTYALLYKPGQDLLMGFYFQAGRKQYFEVVFVRQK